MAKKIGGMWVVYDDLNIDYIDYRLLDPKQACSRK
jgi:hypothetical protein